MSGERFAAAVIENGCVRLADIGHNPIGDLFEMKQAVARVHIHLVLAIPEFTPTHDTHDTPQAVSDCAAKDRSRQLRFAENGSRSKLAVRYRSVHPFSERIPSSCRVANILADRQFKSR